MFFIRVRLLSLILGMVSNFLGLAIAGWSAEWLLLCLNMMCFVVVVVDVVFVCLFVFQCLIRQS